ncbi:MAG: APC family permease [Dongiaceae bacterium]
MTAGTIEGMFGIAAPWWVWSLIGVAIVAVLGYRQIDLSAKVLAVLVTVEYIAVLILDAAIVANGGAGDVSLVSFTPGAFFTGSATIGVLLCFAAFMGFEATTIYSEEARDPKRTVPRATYLAVLVIGIFYAFSTWCMVIAVGADKVVDTIGGLGDPTTYVFTLSDQYAGPWLTTVMSLLLISSVFAALLAFHNAAARYFYVMGREGLMPAKLGHTHGAHQSPHLGSVVQTVLAVVVLAIFVITGQDPIFALFTWLANLATLGVITLMALVSFAVIAFFRQQPALEPSAFKVTLAPLVAGVVLAIIAILVVVNFGLLTGAAQWLAVGLPILVPVAAVLGALAAGRLKQSEPARFSQLGAHQPRK